MSITITPSLQAKELSKRTNFLIITPGGDIVPSDFDHLEDMIGMIETKKSVDIEDIIHKGDFDIASKKITF